jgi:histidyl-tRNA synthetase
VIIGDNELARSGATLRDLKTSTQREVKQSDLVAEISAAALGGRAS